LGYQRSAKFRYVPLTLVGNGAETLDDVIRRKFWAVASNLREDFIDDAGEFFQFVRAIAGILHVVPKPTGCRLVRTEPAP
jgi:hypothetical protein